MRLEQITPYPPGIPVLRPGERIGQEALDYLDYLVTGVQAGMVLPDPTAWSPLGLSEGHVVAHGAFVGVVAR